MALKLAELADGKRLIVAVSGGTDSLALLYSLHHLRDELGLHLHGAHLNHMLRGEASEADALFVEETFQSLGLAYSIEHADVNAVREQRRLSLEEAAREVRYAFLSRVAAEHNAHAIVTGHTSDDQAETVLMNILRGAGLTGLRGIEPITYRIIEGNNVTLARPLLNISRNETEGYCRALGLTPRLDESNLSPEMRRNRVRLELLPILEQYNPAIRDALLRLSRSAVQDATYIETEVQKVWSKAVRQGEEALFLNINAFRQLAPAIQNSLLRRAISEVKGGLQEAAQNHIYDMARLISGSAGKSLDLPGGLHFEVGYSEAVIASSPKDSCPLPLLEGEQPLNVPGETSILGWRITASVFPKTEENPSQPHKSDANHHAERFDFDRMGEQLLLRPRTPGDRFQPLGMSGTKKLQDFMVDEKIPRGWRDRVPLVVSAKGIAWVVGYRIAEWARVGENTAQVLELRFDKET